MNLKRLFILMPAVFLAGIACAQAVRFAYDPAGNRISRTVVLSTSANAPALQQEQEEAQEEAQTPPQPFVEQLTADLQVRIFPNPTGGLLNIEIAGLTSDDDPVQIALFAQNGQQLLTLQTAGALTPADLSAFPAGMYILRLTVRGKAETYQIIKK
jgi:hypothetical protein